MYEYAEFVGIFGIREVRRPEGAGEVDQLHADVQYAEPVLEGEGHIRGSLPRDDSRSRHQRYGAVIFVVFFWRFVSNSDVKKSLKS